MPLAGLLSHPWTNGTHISEGRTAASEEKLCQTCTRMDVAAERGNSFCPCQVRHSGKEGSKALLAGGQPFSPQNGLRLQTRERKDILLTTDIESLLYASVNPTAGGLESMVRCDAALILPSKGQQGSRVSSPGFLQGASELGERDGRSAPLLFMMQPHISKFDLLGASKIRNGCQGSC